MKDTQQAFNKIYLSHVFSNWLREIGRVFIFAATAAIIINFISTDGISMLRTTLIILLGASMMLIGISWEHWLLKKKFNSLNL
jgi:DNA modification methylase